jgi:glycosyltransferase involved in cell wall biosynthesis
MGVQSEMRELVPTSPLGGEERRLSERDSSRDPLIAELEALVEHLQGSIRELEGSSTYRVGCLLRGIAHAAAPPGSRRYRAVRGLAGWGRRTALLGRAGLAGIRQRLAGGRNRRDDTATPLSEKHARVQHAIGSKPRRDKPLLGFVLPCSGLSGGIAVLCQYVLRLKSMGYEVRLYSVLDDEPRVIDWFPRGRLPVVPLRTAPREHFDVLIATGWQTARPVCDLQAERKFYFIQSDETRFYPDDDERRQAARETYSYPLEPIVIARWQQDWLRREFGRESHYVPNGLDHDLFKPAGPVAPRGDRVRVLLEGPIAVPYKGMANAFRAVQGLDCEVWCVSSVGKPELGWRCDRLFEKVPMDLMKHIYSSCDIFLKMSEVEGFFGPPMEMMACGQGACVVGEVTGRDEYCVAGENCLVVPQGDVGAARAAVQRLIEDIPLRQRLIENGLQTAARFDWDRSATRLVEVLRGASAIESRPRAKAA